jgi:hypothetical protein
VNGPLSVRNVLPADPIAWINAEFENLHRQIAELRTARSGNAMKVDGNAAFGGDMTISGDLAVTGTLSLPAGIINNDALANPVTAKRLNPYNSGFTIGTSFAACASDYIATPTGFTAAVIMATGHVTGVNSTASAGLLQVRLAVNGFAGAQQVGEAQASEYVQVSNSYATVVGNLEAGAPLTDGQHTTIEVQAAVNAGSWNMAGSDNIAQLSVVAVFLRP